MRNTLLQLRFQRFEPQVVEIGHWSLAFTLIKPL